MDANDEDSFEINATNNAIIEWRNKVPSQNTISMRYGKSIRKFSAGKWTVNFDGDAMIGTGDNFGGKNYSIFTISDNKGDNERLISVITIGSLHMGASTTDFTTMDNYFVTTDPILRGTHSPP